MPFYLNDYAKGKSTSNRGFLHSFAGSFGTSNLSIRIHSTAFPALSAYVPVGTLPTGIVTFTGLNVAHANGTLVIASGVTTVNATATGTAVWATLYNGSSPGNQIATDSVGLAGSNSLITLSTLNLTAGSSVSVSLNLRVL